MSVFEIWGMRCPQCGDDSHINLVARVTVRLTPDGTVALDGDHEWDSDSSAICAACDHVGTVKNFTVQDSVPGTPKPQQLHCDKCGMVIPGGVFTDTGHAGETGKTFFYCSAECAESH